MNTNIRAQHIKDRNLDGYVVNRTLPFLKLSDAESCCAALGVEPDADHLVYDVDRARELAKILLPEIDWMREAAWNRNAELSAGISERAEQLRALDEAGTEPAYLMQCYWERHSSNVYKRIGRSEGAEILRERRWELWHLTRLRSDNTLPETKAERV